MSIARFQGNLDAISAFGLEKTGVDWAGIGEGAKRIMIGQPRQVWDEFKNNKLTKPGGMLHDTLFPKTWWGKGLTYGLPLIGVASSLGAPKEHRGSALGEVIGGTVGGTLGLPLGIVGSSIGANIVGRFGKSVGSAFDSRPGYRAPELPMPYGRPPVQRALRPLSDEMAHLTDRPEFAF